LWLGVGVVDFDVVVVFGVVFFVCFVWFCVWGVGKKHAVLLRNLLKHLSNWPVMESSGCIVTTIQ